LVRAIMLCASGVTEVVAFLWNERDHKGSMKTHVLKRNTSPHCPVSAYLASLVRCVSCNSHILSAHILSLSIWRAPHTQTHTRARARAYV
jgi:hypothetical protein